MTGSGAAPCMYAVSNDKLHHVLDKENEAASILHMIGENPGDTECVLNGIPLGVVKCIKLDFKAGILAGYD